MYVNHVINCGMLAFIVELVFDEFC